MDVATHAVRTYARTYEAGKRQMLRQKALLKRNLIKSKI